MKMGAAERVSPLQGSLSFSPLTHHFVVGFASLCHGSSHDLPLSAVPLHPSTRGACRGPRLRRLEAWQKRAFASTGIPPWLKQHSICQRPTRHRPEPCIFEAKTGAAPRHFWNAKTIMTQNCQEIQQSDITWREVPNLFAGDSRPHASQKARKDGAPCAGKTGEM